jgi:hypothetical protein
MEKMSILRYSPLLRFTFAPRYILYSLWFASFPSRTSPSRVLLLAEPTRDTASGHKREKKRGERGIERPGFGVCSLESMRARTDMPWPSKEEIGTGKGSDPYDGVKYKRNSDVSQILQVDYTIPSFCYTTFTCQRTENFRKV